MSDEQVNGIPMQSDPELERALRRDEISWLQEAASTMRKRLDAQPDNLGPESDKTALRILVKLERIARSEQALAALEAENATLKSFQYNFEHATSLERAENEQKVAALEAERDEFKRKCEELCCAHGSALIEIHRGWADALAALEARNKELARPLSDEEKDALEDAIEIGAHRTWLVVEGILAARAALKGAS